MQHVLNRIATSVDLALVVIWVGCAAYYWLAGSRRPVLRRHRRSVVARVAVGALILAVAVTKPAWLVGPEGLFPRSWFFLPPLAGLGLLLVTAGFALAVWARINLGELWSGHAEVKEGHRLIQHGAFAIVRHPIYIGISLMLVGTSLVAGSPGWLLVILVTLPYYTWRIGVEERLMREQFGQQWLDYQGRVGAVVPRAVRAPRR